jgi:hypothetical protein
MRRNGIRSILLLLAAGLSFGCGGSPQPQPAPEVQEKKSDRPNDYKLQGPVDVSLAALLALPRKQLTSQADELAERIRLQQRKHREGEMPYNLLPDFHVPLAVPVFRSARYSSALDLSLPGYVEGAEKDNIIALHLARYGDVDAALKLADSALRKRIEASRYEKNYPLEWTRLAALYLHIAQVRLAQGDEQGGRLLVGLHHQLQTVLDTKAQGGLLGATLLPRGRGVLTQAAEAWRKAKEPLLADQADKILAQWGTAPAWVSPFADAPRKEQVADLLAGKGQGHALAAASPARALDLFGLPFPDEGVDAVIATFNASDRLAEILVTYRPHMFMIFPKPEHLGQLVEEWGLNTRDSTTGSVKKRRYRGGDLGVEIATIPDHTALGGLVRISSVAALKATPALDRSFGPVHLDQAYEQNRLRFARDQKGRKLTVDRAEDLKKLADLLPPLVVDEATLESDPSQRVVTRVWARFALDRHGLPSLGNLALPLLEKGGPAQIEATSSKDGYALVLVWKDVRTRLVFTLPHGKRRGASLELVDETSAGEQGQRSQEVAARDRADRRQRILDRKPLCQIPREREKIGLGMTEAEVTNVFSQEEGWTRRAIPGGLAVGIDAVPEKSPGYFARELFARIGPDQRVAEVRIRYANHPGAKGGASELLEKLRDSYGASHELPGSWVPVWADYPKRAPAPTFHLWEDDVTILTCQRDSEGIELTLRDRPLDQEDGIPLGPFQCVSAGPTNCLLGMKQAELLKLWTETAIEGNVLILTPPAESPYSHIQAYLQRAGGPVVRIVAIHSQKWERNPGQEKLEEAVQLAWEKEKASLGYWRRADLTANGRLQSLTGHDDVRRVSVFWQESKTGPRLYTEWTPVENAKK